MKKTCNFLYYFGLLSPILMIFFSIIILWISYGKDDYFLFSIMFTSISILISFIPFFLFTMKSYKYKYDDDNIYLYKNKQLIYTVKFSDIIEEKTSIRAAFKFFFYEGNKKIYFYIDPAHSEIFKLFIYKKVLDINKYKC